MKVKIAMKELVKKIVLESVKIILSALLAALGLTASGCYTTGEGSAACLINIEEKGN